MSESSFTSIRTVQHNPYTSPFFIVGCPRSGTTLIQVMLDAHPNIAIPPESHIFERFSDIFTCYGDLEKRSNLRVLVNDLLSDLRIRAWDLGIDVFDFCERVKAPSIRAVISQLFQAWAKKQGKKLCGDKTPQHAFYLKEIRTVFPEAKIIHVIRDGRDVAESLKRVFIGPRTIYGIAHRWAEYIYAVQEFREAHFSDSLLEVHYEDFVKNPKHQLNRILRFLGEDLPHTHKLNPTTEQKDYYLRRSAHHSSLSQPVTDSKVGIFTKHLTEREIEIFESIAAEALELSGYALINSSKTLVMIHEKLHFLIAEHFLRYISKLFSRTGLRQLKRDVLYNSQLYFRKFIRTIGASLRTKIIDATS